MEQGYEDVPLAYQAEPTLLTQRPFDDLGIKYRRNLMNEDLARFKKQLYEALRRGWPGGMAAAPPKMWSPIYVMKANLKEMFTQWQGLFFLCVAGLVH